MSANWYCYIIANGRHTYNGSTNDLRRRLRQHNGEITGGARATSRVGPGWRYVAVVGGFPDHVNTLQCEWRIKCPSGRPGRREPQWCGVAGRVRGLAHVLQQERWTGQSTIDCDALDLKVWVVESHAAALAADGLVMPAHVSVEIVADGADFVDSVTTKIE